MKRILCLLMCLAPAWAQSAGLGRSGQVTGKVMGEDGTAIAGAFVSLALLPPHPKGLPRANWTAVTGSDGAFQLPGLTAGSYRLCAQVPKSGWLNPCQWGLQTPRVILSAEQPIANALIAMKKGAAVPIRIEDAGQLLPQHDGKTRGADLLVGVAHDAFGFMTARVVSRDSQGTSLEVVIPFDSARMLVVRSAFFQLADGLGTVLSSGRATMIPVAVATGQRPAEVRLRVTGVGQQ